MDFNKSHGIAKAMLTLSAPGSEIAQGHGGPAKLAAQTNDFLVKIRDRFPSQYGFFAKLPPLWDTQTCLQEIDRAFDVLHADGVILFTRYGPDHQYLGHPDFAPVWERLNSKKAIVFTHPTHSVDPGLVNGKLPQPMLDYTHETTRAAVDMIMAGIVRRFPDYKIILSHAGGTLPYLVLRPAWMLPYVPKANDDLPGYENISTEQFVADAKEFFYDTALSGDPLTLEHLKAFAKPDHILFGSDYPYAPLTSITFMTQATDRYLDGKPEAETWMRGNALKLFPRLQ